MTKLPPAYRGDGPYVFVCYAHADAQVVMAEIDWLRRHGINVWYDEGISPGAEWREELGDAIRKCRLFLFFVSPASIASPNCRRELNFVLDDDRATLAIHLEETMLSDGLRLSLSDRQAIFRHLESEESYRDKLTASIDRAFAAEAGTTGKPHGVVASARKRRRAWSRLALLAAMASMLAVAWYAGLRMAPAPPLPAVTAFEMGPVDALDPFSRSLAISADGRYLAYLDAGATHTRALDALDTAALGALGSPFFSPDGVWVAGLTGAGTIARVPRAAGEQSEITRATSGSRFYGGSWGDSGVIVYADNRGLFRIASDGSEPELLAAPDSAAGEIFYGAPEWLPGERSLLFTIAVPNSAQVAVLDLETLEKRVLLPAAFNAQYVDGGYLVFAKADGLYAVRFDVDATSAVGEPISLDIRPALTGLGTQFAVSASGTLAYVPARKEDPRTPPSLSWVNRAGAEEPVGAPAANWVYPRLSPDGRYVVADVFGTVRNIQSWDLQRRNMIPLTDTPTEDISPLWSSDGHTVYFSSNRRGTFDVFAVPADGSGAARLIYGADHFEAPQALTPGDARLVICVQEQGWDLYSIDPTQPDALVPLLVTPYNELNPSLSPDGRWFAYQSDVSGSNEIYVRSFGDPQGRRWKVSIEGGTAPLWSPSSDEIFFRSPNGDVVAASYVTEPDFDINSTVTLFSGEPYLNTGGARNYDISPTDGRFLMLRSGKQPEGPLDKIVVVVNWSETLKRLLPSDSR